MTSVYSLVIQFLILLYIKLVRNNQQGLGKSCYASGHGHPTSSCWMMLKFIPWAEPPVVSSHRYKLCLLWPILSSLWRVCVSQIYFLNSPLLYFKVQFFFSLLQFCREQKNKQQQNQTVFSLRAKWSRLQACCGLPSELWSAMGGVLLFNVDFTRYTAA